MRQILSFFAGVCLVMLTAAATGITEVKPVTPKSVVSKAFNYNSFSSMNSFILEKSKQGYILHTIHSNAYGGIVVMEKY